MQIAAERAVRPSIHSGMVWIPQQDEIIISSREVVRRHKDWGRQVRPLESLVFSLRRQQSSPRRSGSSHSASHPPMLSSLRRHKDWGRQVRPHKWKIFNLHRHWQGIDRYTIAFSQPDHQTAWDYLAEQSCAIDTVEWSMPSTENKMYSYADCFVAASGSEGNFAASFAWVRMQDGRVVSGN